MPIPADQLRAHHVTRGKQVDVRTPLGYVYRVRVALGQSRSYVTIDRYGQRVFYDSIDNLRTALEAL